jgi:hypothetical protein
MFIAFMTSISNSHGAVFAFLVNGDLMISMGFAFRTVGSHLFRNLHTDQLRFATYQRVSYLFLANAKLLR